MSAKIIRINAPVRTLPFEPTTQEMVQENARVRAELFKTLSRIEQRGDRG